MILVEIKGGLGNQMFQYAIGYLLSIRYNQPLILKDKIFEDKLEHTIINYFPRAKYQLASQKQIDLFYKFTFKKKVKRILGMPFHKVYTEESLNYDPKVFQIASPLMIKGFWQSQKYYFNFEHCIRDVFQFNSQIDDISNNYLKKILAKNNSVAIHVRRGDYISNQNNYLRHGVCSIDYYISAINHMKKLLKNPYFFVFTDDKIWAYENIFKINTEIEVVETINLGNSSWKDIYLMSLCQNQIIANSTFSWWAAWLNDYKNKNVIAPQKWFALEYLNDMSGDIVPENWIKL